MFFEYRFSRKEVKDVILKSGFQIIEIIPIDHEFGLIHGDFLFKIFFGKKNSTQLNRLGKMFAQILKNISPWITPHMILTIAKKV